jgi:DNA polymerase-4
MQISIDEAFLNITGMEGLLGPPESAAQKLKNTVYEKTGLTVSVGIASNKYIAKIASGMSKPDGLYIVPPGGEEAFMLSLPLKKIWGAGEKTQELFRRHGLKTCKELHGLSLETLSAIFGNSFGGFLYRAVRGEAAETFDRERGGQSISAERTFAHDLYDEFAIETALFDICQTLMWRLIACGGQSRTISIKIRYDDFFTVSGRVTFPKALCTLNELYEGLRELFHKKYQRNRGVRLIGAGLMNLESGGSRQAELFEEANNEKERHLEKAIFEINKKFPNAVLKRGRSWLSE